MKRRMKAMAAGALIGFAMLAGGAVSADQQQAAAGTIKMLIERSSPLAFEETLERIEANARDMGWKVPQKWKVDFQRNFKKITGTDIGPSRVLKMCEPFAAAKLLVKDEYKQLAAMMPCTIAVYEKSDGKTYIAMMNLDAMAQMYGGDVKDMAAELAPQMEQMLRFD
jgi:uncharacterized protein (DUF302 family)